MSKIIPISAEMLKIHQEVTQRMAVLSEALAKVQAEISVAVELSTRPASLRICLYHWQGTGRVASLEDTYAYWEDGDVDTATSPLLEKLSSWEKTYGVR